LVFCTRKRLRKNLNSDDHFDRSFALMAMEPNDETNKKGTTMNSSIHFKKVLILLLLITLALVALASPVGALANEVTNWNQIATERLAAFPAPAGGAAPALQINMGMTQGAVYDAVNAIEPRHQPYLLTIQFNPTASKDAAVATAAWRVLSDIVSSVPLDIQFPNRDSFVGDAVHGLPQFAERDTRQRGQD
jgi:hypothetical protein